MLTARSRAIVAWMTRSSEILCPACAVAEQNSPLELARIEAGLDPTYEGGPTPLIAYNLDEYHGERQYEEVEMAKSEGDLERAREIEDDESGYPCDRCGKEIKT
jgi:hypothetical protein